MAPYLLDVQSSVRMAREFLRGDRFVYRLVAGEHLLVALRGDRVAPLFVLTPTAARLWEQLATWQSADALIHLLTTHYEVDSTRASTDVRDFLEQLTSLGALESRENIT